MSDDDIVRELRAIRSDLANQTHCTRGDSGYGCLIVILLLILLFLGPCNRANWELGPISTTQSVPADPVDSKALTETSGLVGGF